jgi:hypothetical protein
MYPTSIKITLSNRPFRLTRWPAISSLRWKLASSFGSVCSNHTGVAKTTTTLLHKNVQQRVFASGHCYHMLSWCFFLYTIITVSITSHSSKPSSIITVRRRLHNRSDSKLHHAGWRRLHDRSEEIVKQHLVLHANYLSPLDIKIVKTAINFFCCLLQLSRSVAVCWFANVFGGAVRRERGKAIFPTPYS